MNISFGASGALEIEIAQAGQVLHFNYDNFTCKKFRLESIWKFT